MQGAARRFRSSGGDDLLFLDEIEKYLAASSEEGDGPTPLFFIFFRLAEWREKSAYRSLARLLRVSSDDITLCSTTALRKRLIG